MTVCPSYPTARAWFAPVAVISNATNNGSGAIRITSASHPFATNQIVLVQNVKGTVEANGLWPITKIDANTYDLQGSTFTHSYAGGGGAQLMAADGMPAWPGPVQSDGSISNAGTSKLRAAGFASTWQVTTAHGTIWTPANCGPMGPLIAAAVAAGDPLFPFTVTINGGAADVGGVDSYAWFLSQRGEPVRYASTLYPTTIQPNDAPQLFRCYHASDGFSGTVTIDVNPSEVVRLFPSSGGVAPTDAASLATLFKNCALYVSRRSDAAFQWARFVPATQ